MKYLIILTCLMISSPSFSKTISCQDSNGVKTFNFELNSDEKEHVFVSGSVVTKIVIANPNKYAETDDFATLTDLQTKRRMTYALVCKDV